MSLPANALMESLSCHQLSVTISVRSASMSREAIAAPHLEIRVLKLIELRRVLWVFVLHGTGLGVYFDY